MAKRIFIFSEQKFPRGSAGANYIEYLSLALTSMRWKVIVIGYGNDNENDQCEEKYIYNGIEYFNEKAEWSVFDKKYDYIKLVDDKYIFTDGDYAIIYSMNYFIIKRVYERFPVAHISCILVERMQPYQFKAGTLNPRYIFYARAEHFIQRKIKKYCRSANI